MDTVQEAWGGELFLLEGHTFKRLGHLMPLSQPGGEKASKEPWRMGASVLYQLGRKSEILKRFVQQPQVEGVLTLLEKQVYTPQTSSCGRLFDAVCALLGVVLVSQYEGEAAMRLESLVTKTEILPDGWHIIENKLDMLPTLNHLTSLNNPVSGSNIFHGTFIAALTEWVTHHAKTHKINTICLSGGCFVNRVLSEGLSDALAQNGIDALFPKAVPPNDGGISLGQAWVGGSACV